VLNAFWKLIWQLFWMLRKQDAALTKQLRGFHTIQKELIGMFHGGACCEYDRCTACAQEFIQPVGKFFVAVLFVVIDEAG